MAGAHNKDIRECVCAGGCTDVWSSQQGHQGYFCVLEAALMAWAHNKDIRGISVCWKLH
jgi:hypothetical protein